MKSRLAVVVAAAAADDDDSERHATIGLSKRGKTTTHCGPNLGLKKQKNMSVL